MERRDLLVGVIGTVTVGALTGCSESGETETTSPRPQPSRLEIRVENEGEQSRDVTFRLNVQTSGADRYEFFELSSVQPGTTREADPRDLQAGSYELVIELPLGSTTIQWTGRECADKLIVITFTRDGEVISDRCPANE